MKIGRIRSGLAFLAFCLFLSACRSPAGSVPGTSAEESVSTEESVSSEESVSAEETIAVSAEAEKEEVPFPEPVNASGEMLSASLLGIETDVREGDGLRIRLENKSDEALMLSAEELVANDCAFTPSYHITLEAGQSRESTVRFPAEEMARYGFTSIGSVRLMLKAADSSGRIQEELLLSQKTSRQEEALEEAREKRKNWSGGSLIGKAGEIAVTGAALEKGEFEQHPVFWVENPTKETVIIRGKNLLVNGEKLPFFLEAAVPSCSGMLAAGAFLTEDLMVHGIREWETISITLTVSEGGRETVIGPAEFPIRENEK